MDFLLAVTRPTNTTPITDDAWFHLSNLCWWHKSIFQQMNVLFMTKSMQISQKLQNQQIIIKVDFIDSFPHPIIAALIDVFAAMQFSPIITSQIFSEVHKKNSSKVREQLLESENSKKLKPVFSDYAAICLFVVSLMWHVEVDFECAMAVLTDGLMNIHKHGNRFFRLEFQKWVVTLDHGFWSSTIQNGKWYEQGLLYGRLYLLWKLQIVLKRHIKKQRRGRGKHVFEQDVWIHCQTPY